MALQTKHRNKIVPTQEIGEYLPAQTLIMEPPSNTADIGTMMFSFSAENPGRPAPAVPDHCFTLTTTGNVEGDYSLDNRASKRAELKFGSIFCMPGGHNCEWSWRPKDGNTEDLLKFVVTISPKTIAEFALTNLDYVVDAEDAPWGDMIDDDLMMRQMILALKENSVGNNFASRLYRDSTTQLLCTHLLKTYYSKKVKPQYKGGLSKSSINKVQEFLHANLHRETTVEDMAQLVGLSRFHFLRQFKVSTGLTPYQYKLGVIIEKSKHELLNSGKSITNIALDLGYTNTSRFSELFKRHTQMTPSQYRKYS